MPVKSHERSINDKKFKKLRVLLVGAEEIIREIRDKLREVGHDVITRETVEDAQELYEKELKKFDVVYHMVMVEKVQREIAPGIPDLSSAGSVSAMEVAPEPEPIPDAEDVVEPPTLEEEEAADDKEEAAS